MRRWGAGIVLAFAAASLTGCGSSTAGVHLTDREKVMNACGNLRARIEGIGERAGIRDPQPATLRGSSTARRLRPATSEALSSLAESARELRGLHAPRQVIETISEGVRGYDAFARQLSGNRLRSETNNLKMETAFALVGLRTAVRCADAETHHATAG